MSGKLYIISTPIGNLGDITLRALDTLRNSDYILAESSERTSKLLNKYNIKNKIITFNKDNEKRKFESILSDLNKGYKISLVTDAGTPLISDPGYELIKRTSSKCSVIPIPGPSSLTCALSISTIPMNNFIFLGFLPKKNNERIKKIKSASESGCPIVIFESKHRIKALLKNIIEIIGEDTLITVFRELTKLHESVSTLKANKLLTEISKKPLSGEITLIVDKAPKPTELIENYGEKVKKLLKRYNVSEIVSIIKLFTNYKKKEIYNFVLKIRQKL